MALSISAIIATALLLPSTSASTLASIARHATPTYGLPPSSSSSAPSGSYKTTLYFPNWDIYGRNYQPADLPADRLTHVLYAFANVKPDTGEVYLSDTYADLEKRYANDSWSDVGNNVYGCVKQLYLLKKQNRHMKVLLSIGGWTYSKNFPPGTATAANRQKFASTAVQFVIDLGFDGLDVDWEYPVDSTEAANWVDILRLTREGLDAYAATLPNQPHFLLTVACPAGPAHYQVLDIAGMDQYVDSWNLMAYDFAGSWDSTAGHQSNLFPSTTNASFTPYSADAAVQYYLSQGVAPQKLIFGMPLYGRNFQQTQGPGTPFTGIGPGSWEMGVYDYKALPRPGAQVHYDSVIGASWSYDPTTLEMSSYDTPDLVRQKSQYIVAHNLGGAMWWEANGDKNSSSESLIAITVGGLAQLDAIENVLDYPHSVYDNLRAGMP